MMLPPSEYSGLAMGKNGLGIGVQCRITADVTNRKWSSSQCY